MSLQKVSLPPVAPVLDDSLKGIGFLVAGVTVFSVQDVIIRFLSAGYPAHEIVFLRTLVAMLPLLIILRLEGARLALGPGQPYLLMVLRGLAGFASYTTYYMALTVLPFAQTVALVYTSPLFVTALSAPLLAEAVGIRRWLAVLAGFAGVVVIVQPDAAAIDPAAGLAVLAALFYAMMIILTRRLGSRVSGASQSIYSMLVFIAASGFIGLLIGDGAYDTQAHPSAHFLLRPWVLPGFGDAGLIALCGLVAGAGLYCLTQAYRVASPSLVAPFEYCGLPWAVLWGFLFWGELPVETTLAGIVLIVGSGLYIIQREAVRGRKTVTGRSLRPRV